MARLDVLIAGGGISGLSALHFLRQMNPQQSVRLFESDVRLGGTIGTDTVDGYSFDWGPNGFLDREPLTLRMCDELGLSGDLERAGASVSNRFILRRGRLRKVPMSPPAFLLSDVLGPLGKLRVLLEPFMARGDAEIDESIYDFARRRIGRAAADYLVQPMVSGVYGGRADRLSLKSCFPIMHEMETEYGSLFRAMIARARQAKKEGRRAGGPSGPGGWLTSFHGGLYKIIERFEGRYGELITKRNGVRSIAVEEDHWRAALADGSVVKAEQVVLALPSYRAAEVVAELSPPLSKALASISYAPISVVCEGYRESSVRRDLDGFGFLVPPKEGRRILGSIWTSSIFEKRAPDGCVQFRTMVGGDGDPESIKLTDGDLTSAVHGDLDAIIGLEGSAETVRIYRWAKGIPQFKIGHSATMATIEEQLRRLGCLHLTGNAYYGIGLNDCVKQSYRVVENILGNRP